MNINNLHSLQLLVEGGEGFIYENPKSNDELIKVFKPNVDLKSKERKVRNLKKKKLPSNIIGPIDIITENNKFVGYSMKKIDGEEFKKLSNKKFVTSNNITNKDILDMLVDIKKVLDYLHTEDIYIGDLNEQNILFDSNFNTYFIDCDSWSIENDHCTVAMDLFKDPLLINDNFNKETDTYAFSILAWKSLTRIHPFGGTMNPDIDILERMKKGISVINNPKVKIPKTIKSWNFLSPRLIDTFDKIFKNSSREINDELDELDSNFVLCSTHKDFYYSKYNKCPICDLNAKVLLKPISQGVVSGLTLIAKLPVTDISVVIDQFSYINNCGYIVNMKYNKKEKFKSGPRYYFTRESLIKDREVSFEIITSSNTYKIEKRFKTQIVVQDDDIFYISKKGSLSKSTVMKQGNSIQKIADCSNNAYFEVYGNHYCVLNIYDNDLLINIDGYNTKVSYKGSVTNYGIHYDAKLDKWLIILEDKSNSFRTIVAYKQGILFDDTRIKYACPLMNICIYNGTIFIPMDNSIRGYAYNKDAFKDFECSVVTNESRLIKVGKPFTIVNEENIYNLG